MQCFQPQIWNLSKQTVEWAFSVFTIIQCINIINFRELWTPVTRLKKTEFRHRKPYHT